VTGAAFRPANLVARESECLPLAHRLPVDPVKCLPIDFTHPLHVVTFRESGIISGAMEVLLRFADRAPPHGRIEVVTERVEKRERMAGLPASAAEIAHQMQGDVLLLVIEGRCHHPQTACRNPASEHRGHELVQRVGSDHPPVRLRGADQLGISQRAHFLQALVGALAIGHEQRIGAADDVDVPRDLIHFHRTDP